MKVLIVGGGGREHALAWKISGSPLLKKLYAAPGNAGLADLAECVPIKATECKKLAAFAKEKEIDLTIIGPEAPLADGIADLFESERLSVFGPSQNAARIESSKAFAKKMMSSCGIPTADSKTFRRVDEAKRYLIGCELPVVIKADGLAAGKGVMIAESCESAIDAVNRMIDQRVFGDAGSQVIIEHCLKGEELSVLLLTDGERILPLASSQDHKRAFDYDKGPNTGGMGAYSPCPLAGDDETAGIAEKTAKPVIDLLRRQGSPYRGLLYVGLMMTADGPQVLEYNVRFGDPETQAVLPRLKTDLLPLLVQSANGKFETSVLEWDTRPCVTVVMASGGYPAAYQTGFEISRLEEAAQLEGVRIFHAGTTRNKAGKICTAGGRVLSISALGDSMKEAYDRAYQAVGKISFDGAFYRRDIAGRVLADQLAVPESPS